MSKPEQDGISAPSPDRSVSGSERKGERRRRAILEAAEKAFGQVGYWTATTADIAKAAGVTQPALYRYFPNKQALFLEALALRQTEIVEALSLALGTPGTSRERIERIGRATLQMVRSYPDMAKLRLQAVVVAAQDETVRDAVHATIDQMLGGHKALIDAAKADGSLPESVDTEVLAATISAYATQLYVALVLDHPIGDIAEKALPTLLSMVAPEPPASSS